MQISLILMANVVVMDVVSAGLQGLQRVFGELGYGPQDHVPFSVLCQHPVVQELMDGATRYQLIVSRRATRYQLIVS